MIKVTVFTPCYNRRHTIEKLYESLISQTCYLFEWVVVDDGSSDDTKEYFEEILKNEKGFNIKYTKVLNGGKHRAINIGLDMAVGEYFFIVDSDDYLTKDSIDLIYIWIKSISETKQNFAGVSGLKGYNQNDMVGKTFKGYYLDCSALDRQKYNILGDKSEVVKTSVLKKYKFPEINGENLMTEDIVWNRIANEGYLIRYFNKINYICEYREDGLTKKRDELFCSNFIGYTLYINELLKYKIILKVKWRAIMAYGYRGRLINQPYKTLAKNINISTPILFILIKFGFFYKRVIERFLKR
ncbi:glycosyltransferase family 2 protein [Psychrobacillus glaciei]|uniref:Glycosyltransferase family 2 protein n=1 Tax=Psychrobacillus glaciei TaxID=2283160 RepID=A0A5J6SPK5_9BACI|nr:glycosyltransferase family 2 protein [Psychrobacillus glaciei]QFF99865.1 glycosyltransferase family 2 protein [Psychrobacillus glaciei]